MSGNRSIINIFLLWILFCDTVEFGNSIDCYKCVSVGGDDKECDDPFHNNRSLDYFESPCLGGRKGRDGLFPATSCVKLNGIFDETGISLTIRGCALDSGTLTTDTELIRMSHCGAFYFNEKYVRGCVQSCNDYDGCNSSVLKKINSIIFLTSSFLIAIHQHVI
ncbi:hypothetical protein HCN44_003561 [Aphidius gifuensis]|uniref:Protein quiver n=1 Tax=Aphidius gifuensis TaxID=684658 RepID=A0A834XK59_APHGI|nr:uncharacterized protein LOC122858924 [Aphidius gifuensis]KAF7987698.1 hypothetical protein HCN44_003561 [Aphidius gifuensis]